MHRSRKASVLFVLVLLGGVLLAGCAEPRPLEDRLLTPENAAAIGLYHCDVATGTNPGQVDPEMFQPEPGNETQEGDLPVPEEAWVQVLGPQEGTPCNALELEDRVLLTAMRLPASEDVQAVFDHTDPCQEQQNVVLYAGREVVGAQGNETVLVGVKTALLDQGSDLLDPCDEDS